MTYSVYLWHIEHNTMEQMTMKQMTLVYMTLEHMTLEQMTLEHDLRHQSKCWFRSVVFTCN